MIPIVLFAYARPEHLKRTLACLRENNVPLIYAFADGPKTPEVEPLVNAARQVLRQVDWCEIHITEREKNLGLGTSILAGVSEIFQKHDAIIVFEDDLICAPGTYQYLCAAMEHYKDTPSVMSVSGFTHPLTTPKDITKQPYFDGRAECWSWGAWARSWQGMNQDALSLMQSCKENQIDIYRYGADLPEMAAEEKQKNLWAVRFSYLHILKKGLCLRPPHSMVAQIGFDATATNTHGLSKWLITDLEQSPPIPPTWPVAVEHTACAKLWQKECGKKPNIIAKLLIFSRQHIKNRLLHFKNRK